MCVEIVSLCTLCGHVDAYVGNVWLLDCCCLSEVCKSLLFHLCVFDIFLLKCVHVVYMLFACGCTCLQRVAE